MLVLSIVVGALNIKEYYIFGGALGSNCPYGGEMGPDGEIINARHICPPDGGGIFWLGVVIFSIILLTIYTLIYGIAYGIFKLYKKIRNF